ncbi:MAG: hypothetical protein CMM52_03855 [Rhodospirillaceae bacterium]|nr:hypothetical protein [Rhodospirillaceae bacterium]|tara:strand:- start:3951 stop:4580 length:630 start_codon:yes stop_codon:yes gene_type:complete
MNKIIKTAFASFLFLGASNASAVVLTSTNTADFNLMFEDFALAPSGVASMTSLSGNLTIDSAIGVGNPAASTGFYGEFAASALTGNEYIQGGDENFDLTFSSLQNAFAMNYSDFSIASTFTLNFFDGATNVGSTSFVTSTFNTAEFIGFSSTVAFDSVEIREDDGASNTNEFFQFYTAQHVSEPGSLAVFGLGLIGLGYMRRRIHEKPV